MKDKIEYLRQLEALWNEGTDTRWLAEQLSELLGREISSDDLDGSIREDFEDFIREIT